MEERGGDSVLFCPSATFLSGSPESQDGQHLCEFSVDC